MASDLIGFAELMKLLGVSKSTAARYTRRPDFPAPAVSVVGGRLWRRRDVERWRKANPPRPPGRPPKPDR